jgi:hypothetical protein
VLHTEPAAGTALGPDPIQTMPGDRGVNPYHALPSRRAPGSRRTRPDSMHYRLAGLRLVAAQVFA